MKLRNKRTGEILNLAGFYIKNPNRENCKDLYFDSLVELNEAWEDYEEPYWYIYGAEPLQVDEQNWNKTFVDELKVIGNYFETKEEAEKAVEKLKAWKRLKQAGLRLSGYQYAGNRLKISANFPGIDVMEPQQRHEDLELLFGGEE